MRGSHGLRDGLKNAIQTEAYLEPNQPSKMERFAKIVNSWKTLFPQNASSQMFDRVLNTHMVSNYLTQASSLMKQNLLKRNPSRAMIGVNNGVRWIRPKIVGIKISGKNGEGVWVMGIFKKWRQHFPQSYIVNLTIFIKSFIYIRQRISNRNENNITFALLRQNLVVNQSITLLGFLR